MNLMPRTLRHSFCLLALTGIMACDSSVMEDSLIQPEIRVEIVDLRESSTIKVQSERSALQEIWTIDLVARNLESGTVYAPGPVTADSDVSSEVRFNLSLPSDSLYEFEVSFKQGSSELGRGLIHHFVSSSTSTITVPAYIADSSNPALVFEPSRVTRPAGSFSPGNTIKMFYLGVIKPAEGLAARLDISGIDDSSLEVEGPSKISDSQSLNLLWNWSASPAGPDSRAAGTISYPTDFNTSFCLNAEIGNVRAVHPDASISRQNVKSEACVQFGN